MADFRGIDVPGDGQDVQYDVVYCQPHAPLDFTCLDEVITGYPVHWVEEEREEKGRKVKFRRTRLCTPCGSCKWCGVAPDAVWVGYLGGYMHRVGKPQIALLSPDAGRQLKAMMVPFTGLRGQRIQIARLNDQKKGKMVVGHSLFPALTPLPAAFPLGPTLRIVYGCFRLPDEISEGADPFDTTPGTPYQTVDDRLPWEKGGMS